MNALEALKLSKETGAVVSNPSYKYRFENLLRQLVSVPAEKVKQIVEKEKRLRKKKRPK